MNQTVGIWQIYHFCCDLFAVEFDQAKDEATINNGQAVEQEESQTGVQICCCL